MKSIFNFFLPFLSAPTVFPIRIIIVSVGEANPGRYFLSLRSERFREIRGYTGNSENIQAKGGGGTQRDPRWAM